MIDAYQRADQMGLLPLFPPVGIIKKSGLAASSVHEEQINVICLTP